MHNYLPPMAEKERILHYVQNDRVDYTLSF